MIGLTIVLLVIAEVLPDLFGATGDINVVFRDNSSDLNNTAAANIATVMPLIIGILVVFAIVGLITFAVSRTRNS